MNKWQFSDDFVKAVYNACVKAGVDYMEIATEVVNQHFRGKRLVHGNFVDDKDLRRIVGENNTDLKLSAHGRYWRIDYDDIPPKSDSLLDMIRVACYVNQIDKAIELAHHCMDKGYEATINLMAVSKVNETELDEGLSDLSKSRVPTIYLVDSFGSMYCEQIEHLMDKYQQSMPAKTIGIHAHNNMQLAFSNTITSIIKGANMLDATLLGIGRGAGNTHLETLMAFLKNPKYHLHPIYQVISEYLIPMQKEITWGYHIPILNHRSYE